MSEKRDGSFDWPKRSDAIIKTRPNDAPPQQPSPTPKLHQKNRPYFADDPEPVGVSKVFLSHPELNAAAIGRRLGISQSLMAQYINGMKKPSKEREALILNEIAVLADELKSICI